MIFKAKEEIELLNSINSEKININCAGRCNINELIEKEYITNENIDKYCITEVVVFNGILQDEYEIINNCEKKEE